MNQKFDVTGMTCSACSAHVEKAVSKVQGVRSVRVNLLANNMSVDYDDTVTGTAEIEQAVEQVFDLRPAAIIRDLDLRRPIYRKLAAFGHMGREDLDVCWERTDRVDALKAALGR